MQLQDYFHEAFQVSGYNFTIQKSEMTSQIQEIWAKFRTSDLLSKIDNVENGSLHAVYHNYNSDSFEMLIGLLTKKDLIQSSSEITTLQIPDQKYKFVELDFNVPDSIAEAWNEINSKSQEEIDRNYKYDLEMYSQDMKKCWIAVSVK